MVKKSKKTHKKATSKKVHKVKKQEERKGVMAIVPYEDIAKPEVYENKYSIVPTPLTERQILAIIAPTPPQIIKKRPSKGGGKDWDYVPGWWFKKKANFVFGFNHDMEIVGERIDGEYITVKVKVTVRNAKMGKYPIVKTDYGGAQIKFRKGVAHTPENYLDIANDFKAAATDGFKRCMVQFGFAMDVYGKNEAMGDGYIVQDQPLSAPKPDLFQQAVSALKSMTDLKQLATMQAQVMTSKLYDDAQKKELLKIIHERLGE